MSERERVSEREIKTNVNNSRTDSWIKLKIFAVDSLHEIKAYFPRIKMQLKTLIYPEKKSKAELYTEKTKSFAK